MDVFPRKIPKTWSVEVVVCGMNTVVDSIKITPYGLVFKRPIDIVNTDEEELTELVQHAAYVGVITISN